MKNSRILKRYYQTPNTNRKGQTPVMSNNNTLPFTPGNVDWIANPDVEPIFTVKITSLTDRRLRPAVTGTDAVSTELAHHNTVGTGQTAAKVAAALPESLSTTHRIVNDDFFRKFGIIAVILSAMVLSSGRLTTTLLFSIIGIILVTQAPRIIDKCIGIRTIQLTENTALKRLSEDVRNHAYSPTDPLWQLYTTAVETATQGWHAAHNADSPAEAMDLIAVHNNAIDVIATMVYSAIAARHGTEISQPAPTVDRLLSATTHGPETTGPAQTAAFRLVALIDTLSTTYTKELSA